MTSQKKIIKAQDLSFDEASRRYPEEWVLLKVTRLDEHGWVSHGHVLEHTPDQRKLNRTLEAFHKEQPKSRVAIFLGGEWGTTAEDFQRAIDEAQKRPFVSVNAWG